MTKREPHNPHDHFFTTAFSRIEVARDFFEQFLPPEVVRRLHLETLKLESSSYVTPELEKRISDLVFTCKYLDGQTVKITLILEHKSYRPTYPHFQLYDYIGEKWRQERKGKEKPTPALCVVLYHGKDKWEYKPMKDDIEGLDDVLLRYNPVFDFELVNLNQFTDEFILQLKVGFLVNALLTLKHHGEEEYIRKNIERIFVHHEVLAKGDSEEMFLLSILVYISKTSEISPKEIKNMQTQSAKLKKTFISGWERESAEWIEKGIEKGIEIGTEKGTEIGTEIGQNLKVLAVIKKGWEEGLPAGLIAKLAEVPLGKVKEEIARLEKEKQKNGNGTN